jgi:hypothetical protein
MKASKRRNQKVPARLKAVTFSLSDAKTHLGRLLEKAGRGEAVYIARGERRFLLQEIQPIDLIPIRPPGYFSEV